MPGRKPTHFDERGKLRMVDVSGKRATRRRAEAAATVSLGADAWRALRAGRAAKGDALAAARIAGIQAAKRTADWIPLCHPVPIEHLEVELRLAEREPRVEIIATAAARWSTGVEMEALTAVAAASLALYDMCKGIDRGIVIGPIRLISKSGGRSGAWRRGGDRAAGKERTARRSPKS